MGKVARGQTKGASSRKDPLLPTTNAAAATKSTRCGACGRCVLLLLPLLACALLIGSLGLLSYHVGVPITDATISRCMADYSPRVDVLVLIFAGATLMFVVTKMRSVQIAVYHRRQQSESRWMGVLNAVAAVSNILAYLGFILLAWYDVDGESKTLHYVGAYTYFILSNVYGLLHSVLTWKQVQYPMMCKVLFTISPVATLVCTAIFAVNTAEHQMFEWFSVALAAVNCGLISTLFLVDNVDDELKEFFCCRRAEKRERNSPTKPPRLA